jgi:hypothetical protein
MLAILRLHECFYLTRISDSESSIRDSRGRALAIRSADDSGRAADANIVTANVA